MDSAFYHFLLITQKHVDEVQLNLRGAGVGDAVAVPAPDQVITGFGAPA